MRGGTQAGYPWHALNGGGGGRGASARPAQAWAASSQRRSRALTCFSSEMTETLVRMARRPQPSMGSTKTGAFLGFRGDDFGARGGFRLHRRRGRGGYREPGALLRSLLETAKFGDFGEVDENASLAGIFEGEDLLAIFAVGNVKLDGLVSGGFDGEGGELTEGDGEAASTSVRSLGRRQLHRAQRAFRRRRGSFWPRRGERRPRNSQLPLPPIANLLLDVAPYIKKYIPRQFGSRVTQRAAMKSVWGQTIA